MMIQDFIPGNAGMHFTRSVLSSDIGGRTLDSVVVTDSSLLLLLGNDSSKFISTLEKLTREWSEEKDCSFNNNWVLPDFQEPSVTLRCWDSKFDLIVAHGNLGIEGTLMVDVSVHGNTGDDELRNVDTYVCRKFHSNGRHERYFLLWIKWGNSYSRAFHVSPFVISSL